MFAILVTEHQHAERQGMGSLMGNRLASPSNFSLAGCLLVAAPSRQDELFAQSVCLIVHHDGQGAIGVVLNRPLPADVPSLWQQLAGPKSTNVGTLHFGGPDAGPVVAVHNAQRYAEFESGEGVYFAAQVQNLQALVSAVQQTAPGSLDLKIIVGQAAWKAGQLEKEFQAGEWLPLPVMANVVFADEHQMWQLAVRQFGNLMISQLTGAVPPAEILSN